MEAARSLSDYAIILDEKDNVATALKDMPAGGYVLGGGAISLAEQVPAGFKVALAAIPAGAEVVKYGYAIGTARGAIRPGQCVHVHNMASSV